MVPTASVIPLVPAWRVDRPFDYLVPEALQGRVTVGSLVRMPFGHRRVRGVVVGLGEATSEGLEEIAGLVTEQPVAPPPLPQVLEWIAERYAAPRGRVYERVVPPRVRVKVPELSSRVEPPMVSGSRLNAYEGGPALAEALSSKRGGSWCLQAAADEDRGELIAELIATTSRGVLICVPEVRYGNRVIETVSRRFPHAVRVDSALSEGDRARGLLALAAGAPIGIGGRATALAPALELGALIVDEEYHPSFKEDRAPRYDARRVAMERARLSGAACVLVASTPSLEWSPGIQRGDMKWIGPSRERARAAKPLVHVVPPPQAGLSHDLHRAVQDELRNGGKVALLVPGAGYARALWCATCRRSVRCPVCEAGMVYARGERAVECPRCTLRQPAPASCPSCGGDEFKYLGAGSERLEEQLGHMFPRARVKRMDPALLETLGEQPAIAVGDADIYVTTWIGTKQVIRPDVNLVGVLDADALIRRPDFRAAERAYQAIAAMAEWAGPRDKGGRVFVQTAEPNHHAVQAVVRGDHRFFLEREAEHRRELGYPPFSELVKVRASGAAAPDLIEKVRSAVGREARVLGPVSVTDRRRRQALEVLIKCPSAQDVAQALRGILPRVPGGSRLRVDVDPR